MKEINMSSVDTQGTFGRNLGPFSSVLAEYRGLDFFVLFRSCYKLLFFSLFDYCRNDMLV